MTALLEFDTGTIELEVSIGVGNQANAWDSSAWDYSQWASDTAGGWVDVTCDVSEVTLTAGASAPDGLLTAINGTTGGLTLHGDQYNPWAPPWGGRNALGPGVPVRIRWRHEGATDFVSAFTGVTDGWPFDRSTGVAAVPILDATGMLANLTLLTLAAPAGQGEGISARINRILDAAGWSTGLRDILADSHPVISTTLGAAPWQLLQTAADTGIGLVWVTRDGVVAYIPVGQAGGSWIPDVLPETLTDTHGSDPTYLCVVNFQNTDPVVVRNIVSITRAADPAVSSDTPVAAIATDATSVSRYGPVSYERTDLINQLDSWSATLAAAVLLGGAWPALHPEVANLDIQVDNRVADLLLGAEIGDAIKVRDSGQNFECIVVGYTVDITNRSLVGSLVLSDITRWVGSFWDSDSWDNAVWSV